MEEKEPVAITGTVAQEAVFFNKESEEKSEEPKVYSQAQLAYFWYRRVLTGKESNDSFEREWEDLPALNKNAWRAAVGDQLE